METVQIYDIVNAINSQTMGTSALTAIDTNSFVAVGAQVLSSETNTEAFLKTLYQRIGKTTVRNRVYRNKLSKMVYTDIEWGAILQKISVDMPDAVEDKSFELVDGQSVDQYIVSKPKVDQSFFVQRTPYNFFVTTQKEKLVEAFISPEAFDSFLTACKQAVLNKIELTNENLTRGAMINFMCNMATTQEIKLLTNYTALTGTVLTAEKALFDDKFLRYAIGQMQAYGRKMESFRTDFNAGGKERFTNASDQYFLMVDDFKTQAETNVMYSAFNTQYLEKTIDIPISYWQNPKDPFDIIGTDAEEEEVTIANIVGAIFDREAVGAFRNIKDVLVTPVNARGGYYNTFYHEQHNYLNDMNENGLIFTLN